MSNILFVSINGSFDPTYTLTETADCVRGNWAISKAKADGCDLVVAMYHGDPVAAFKLHGAALADETYQVSATHEAPRVVLLLGEPMPVLPAYRLDVSLRRGVSVIEI
jgi:hypothetical protein